MVSLVNSIRHLKKKSHPFLTLFQKIEEDKTFPNLCYDVSITHIKAMQKITGRLGEKADIHYGYRGKSP